MSVAQGFPRLKAPVVDANGTLLQPWLQFFITLWQRTGEAISEIVSGVSIVSANGVSGSVENPNTTPAITIILGNITPQSVVASGIIEGSNLSGTNTGDQTITLIGDVIGSGNGAFPVQVVSLSGIPFTAASTTLGITATINTAKLTTGGANGSMVFTNGVLTAQIPAT